MTPTPQYLQLPIGVPTNVLQNQTFGIPTCSCRILSSVALEFGFFQTGPFVASAESATVGTETPATWGRCATGAAVVLAKAS
jgi:hypothetical protein